VEASHQLILLGSTLVLLSIFAGLFSARLGAPLLLVFLGLGMLAGGEGPGGIRFGDFPAAYLIGRVSLAIILFDGGLRTDPGAVPRALWPSVDLATVGVIATAAIAGAAAVLLFSTSWVRGFLVGAIVAPTMRRPSRRCCICAALSCGRVSPGLSNSSPASMIRSRCC
jgi:cell volume regulation protein A